MRMLQTVLAAGLALLIGALAGCGYDVNLTVTNATDVALPVFVSASENARQSLGEVAADGGRVSLDLHFAKLPAKITVEAGDKLTESVMYNQGDPKKVYFDVTLTGSLRYRLGDSPAVDEKKVDVKIYSEPVEVID